jgi:hypothetical protein
VFLFGYKRQKVLLMPYHQCVINQVSWNLLDSGIRQLAVTNSTTQCNFWSSNKSLTVSLHIQVSIRAMGDHGAHSDCDRGVVTKPADTIATMQGTIGIIGREDRSHHWRTHAHAHAHAPVLPCERPGRCFTASRSWSCVIGTLNGLIIFGTPYPDRTDQNYAALSSEDPFHTTAKKSFSYARSLSSLRKWSVSYAGR